MSASEKFNKISIIKFGTVDTKQENEMKMSPVFLVGIDNG